MQFGIDCGSILEAQALELGVMCHYDTYMNLLARLFYSSPLFYSVQQPTEFLHNATSTARLKGLSCPSLFTPLIGTVQYPVRVQIFGSILTLSSKAGAQVKKRLTQ